MGPPLAKFDLGHGGHFRTFADNVRKRAKNVREEPEMSGKAGLSLVPIINISIGNLDL